MNHDSNKYAEDFSRFQKRQKIADDEPQAYAAADENSSDSDDEVISFISNEARSTSSYLHERGGNGIIFCPGLQCLHVILFFAFLFLELHISVLIYADCSFHDCCLFLV